METQDSVDIEENSLDLLQLINLLWQNWKTVLIICSLSAVFSVFYALSLPNIYQSKAMLVPVDTKASGAGFSASTMLSSIDVTSILSGNMGSTKSNDISIETIQSLSFFTYMQERRDFFPQLLALKEYNLSTNELIYDPEIYDESSSKWVREVRFPKTNPPSIQEAYKTFNDMFDITVDKRTGLVSVIFEHQSPYVAEQMLSWIISDVNNYIRDKEKKVAQESLVYLQEKISTTNISEIRRALALIIQDQINTVMLAEVSDEYAFKVIEEPVVEENKIAPNRALTCVLISIIGGILSVIFVLIRHFFFSRENAIVEN